MYEKNNRPWLQKKMYHLKEKKIEFEFVILWMIDNVFLNFGILKQPSKMFLHFFFFYKINERSKRRFEIDFKVDLL